jgi:DivIVA domain-containing protein
VRPAVGQRLRPPPGDGDLRPALRGYARRDVDALLDRCAAALGDRRTEVPELAGRTPSPCVLPAVARDVREARFRVVVGGYDLAEVDALLRRLAGVLPDPPRPCWDGAPLPPAPGPGPRLRTALRGYARDDVDVFLVRCAHSLGRRVGEVPELAALTGAPRVGEPLDARDVDTAQFPLAYRGYAPEAVDALLDRVRDRLRG